VKTIVIVDTPRSRPSARDRLLALQNEQFTPEVRREAEQLLGELVGDSTPEIEAMRRSILECSQLADALKHEADLRRIALCVAILATGRAD
jgi:hypothetical protein